MAENQWDAATGRLLVNTVDGDAVDVDKHVSVTVEAVLLPPPVESVGPVREQFLQVAELGALGPARAGDLVRPAGRPDPRPQIVEDRVLDRDGERLDAYHPLESTYPPESTYSPVGAPYLQENANGVPLSAFCSSAGRCPSATAPS